MGANQAEFNQNLASLRQIIKSLIEQKTHTKMAWVS
jgi:hypothetical protein